MAPPWHTWPARSTWVHCSLSAAALPGKQYGVCQAGHALAQEIENTSFRPPHGLGTRQAGLLLELVAPTTTTRLDAVWGTLTDSQHTAAPAVGATSSSQQITGSSKQLPSSKHSHLTTPPKAAAAAAAVSEACQLYWDVLGVHLPVCMSFSPVMSASSSVSRVDPASPTNIHT